MDAHVVASLRLWAALGCMIGVMALAGGCRAKNQAVTEACTLGQGELVITELMPAPDDGPEWLELHNPTSRILNLNRMVVAVTTASDHITHVVVGRRQIAPGGYYVIADQAAPFVDYGLDGRLGLSNEGARVTVTCARAVVDELLYRPDPVAGAATKGRSVAYSAGAPLDARENDQDDLWCAGGAPYDGTNRGTPGGPNDLCGRRFCREDGGIRGVRRPAPGELLINEVFADPVGADEGREWLELYVAAIAAVDLNGLSVTHVNGASGNRRQVTLESAQCLPAAPATHVVLGTPEDAAAGPTTSVAMALNLYNGDGEIQLHSGDGLVDRARVPAAAAGVAVSLNPQRLDAASNDRGEAFCAARSRHHFAGLGTPGSDNDPCGAYCREAGAWRPLEPLAAGDLVISEVFANPDGRDQGRDWLEVYVAAESAVSLNGLFIRHDASDGGERQWALGTLDCIGARPGAYVVIGGENAAGDGVAVDVVAQGLDLYATKAGHVHLESAGQVVDRALVPAAVAGAAQAVTAVPPLAAAVNDAPADWCVSADQLHGVAGSGSPGQANGTCR